MPGCGALSRAQHPEEAELSVPGMAESGTGSETREEEVSGAETALVSSSETPKPSPAQITNLGSSQAAALLDSATLGCHHLPPQQQDPKVTSPLWQSSRALLHLPLLRGALQVSGLWFH